MKPETLHFDSLDTRDCPYYLLTRASLSTTSEFKKAFTEAGIGQIKPAYLGVLMCLWKDECLNETLGKLGTPDGIKIADLGRCAGLEPSSMTGIIDRMERDGLLRRVDDPEDRRAQNIHLTDEGNCIRNIVVIAVNAALRKSFAGIDPGQLAVFTEVLRQVLINTNRGDIS